MCVRVEDVDLDVVLFVFVAADDDEVDQFVCTQQATGLFSKIHQRGRGLVCS